MADEIRFIGELERLEVKPNDRFVITVDALLSMEMAEWVGERVARALGVERERVLVLGRGMKLGAISQEAA